jgi:beta-lactamase class D
MKIVSETTDYSIYYIETFKYINMEISVSDNSWLNSGIDLKTMSLATYSSYQ